MIAIDVQNLARMQCDSASLSLQSMNASTLSLTFARVDAVFVSGWKYGECIRLSLEGQVIYEGWIKDIEHSINATSSRMSITAYDRWEDEGKNIYFASDRSTTGYIGRANTKNTVHIDDSLIDVFKLGGAEIVTGTGTRSEIVPFASSSETRLNVAKKVGRWCPNLISRTEFDKPEGSDESRRKITIATPREFPPVILDIDDILTENIQLKPRYDLCPSSVTLIRHWTDSLGYNHTTTWTVPEGGDARAVDAFVFETNDTAQGDNEDVESAWGGGPGTPSGEGSGSNKVNTPKRMTIKGRHIPTKGNIQLGWTNNVRFWSQHFPILKGLDTCLEWGELKIVKKEYDEDAPDTGASDSEAAKPENRRPRNYSTDSDLKYELYEGSISEQFRGCKWCNATLEIEMKFSKPQNFPQMHSLSRFHAFIDEDIDVKQNIYDANRMKKRTLSIDCLLIDRFFASYLETADCPEVDPAKEDYPTDQDKEDAEKEIPADYAAAAQAYYDATRDLQYDGTINIRQCPSEAIKYLGCYLSIRGGLQEWEKMRTIVQGVGIDLLTHSVSLTLGAREQQFETPKTRNLTKEAREQTEETRASGNMAGSGGGGLSDTNKTATEREERKSKINRPVAPAVSPNSVPHFEKHEYVRKPFEVVTTNQSRMIFGGRVHSVKGAPFTVENKEIGVKSEQELSQSWYLNYKIGKDKSVLHAELSDTKAVLRSFEEACESGIWPAVYSVHICVNGTGISQCWLGDVYFDGSGRKPPLPFEVYKTGDNWLINGGKVVSPLGEPTDPALYQAVNGVIATPGKWYLNYRVDREDKLVTFAGLSQKWQPIHMFDLAYKTDTFPALYCIHIATVKDDGTVIQHHTGDVYFEAELYPPGGMDLSIVPGPDISIVPGPGIDAERTDSVAGDGTPVIRYDIKGRLAQYKNTLKADEQGDITGISVYLNPSYTPRKEAAAYIHDGHVLVSIVPGPMTKVAAGENISVVASQGYEDGWPAITYTVSTTKDGGAMSIVPGPGIEVVPGGGSLYRVEGVTARYNQPGELDRLGDMAGAAIAIKPSYNPNPNSIPYIIDGMLEISIVPGPVTRVYAGAGVSVDERRHEENGWPILSYTVSASGAADVEPGRYSDPLRPATGYNAAQMEANGWTQVSGYWKDPTGHSHMCFMACRSGKLYFHMFPDGWDV